MLNIPAKRDVEAACARLVCYGGEAQDRYHLAPAGRLGLPPPRERITTPSQLERGEACPTRRRACVRAPGVAAFRWDARCAFYIAYRRV